jgi:transmembrane sensor
MEMKEREDALVQMISDQAAEWFIRLKDRDLSIAERRKFVRWLKQSPSHIAEFMRLCQLYGRVKRAKVPTLAPEEAAESNVIALMQMEPVPEPALEPAPASEPAAEPPRRLFDSHKVRFAVAACCLVLVGLIAKFVISSNTIETHAGEWRTVQLADGSFVTAGANTLMHVEFSEATRRIHLERGEAMFKVTRDSARPFIVNAGSAIARAVGTRFGVDRREDKVTVTVAEGTVAVVRAEQAAALERQVDLTVALALVADEGVEIPVNAPTVRLQKEKVNSAHALAWASGQLILQRESIGEAVAEFNRRNLLQIVIDDPAIANGHLCCVFDAADPEAFAKLIAGMSDDVMLVRDGPNVLRIVPRGAGQAEPPSRDDAI